MRLQIILKLTGGPKMKLIRKADEDITYSVDEAQEIAEHNESTGHVPPYVIGAEELKMILDNEERLYNWKLACFKNLTSKKFKGIYDKNLAPKIFIPLVNEASKKAWEGAKSYFDDGTPVAKVTREVKDEVIKELVAEFENAFENVDYSFMEVIKGNPAYKNTDVYKQHEQSLKETSAVTEEPEVSEEHDPLLESANDKFTKNPAKGRYSDPQAA